MSKKERKQLEEALLGAMLHVIEAAKINPSIGIKKQLKKDCKSWSKKLLKKATVKASTKPVAKKAVAAKKPVKRLTVKKKASKSKVS